MAFPEDDAEPTAPDSGLNLFRQGEQQTASAPLIAPTPLFGGPPPTPAPGPAPTTVAPAAGPSPFDRVGAAASSILRTQVPAAESGIGALAGKIGGAVGSAGSALGGFYQQHIAPAAPTAQDPGVQRFYAQHRQPDWMEYGQLTPAAQAKVLEAYRQSQVSAAQNQQGMVPPGPVQLGRTALEKVAPAIPKAYDQAVWAPLYEKGRREGVPGASLPAWEQATPEQRQQGILNGMGPFAMGLGPAEAEALGASTAAATGLAGQAVRGALSRPAEGTVPAVAPEGALPLREPQPVPELSAETQTRLQGQLGAVNLQTINDTLDRMLPGGKVQDTKAVADALSTFDPADAQAIADRKIMTLSNQLDDLYATGAGEEAIRDMHVEIGKFEAARDNVVLGRDHRSTPIVDQILNELAATDMPTGDGNALLQRGRGKQAAVLNLGDMLRKSYMKAVPSQEDRIATLRLLNPKRAMQPAQLFDPLSGAPPPEGEGSSATGMVPTGPGARPIPDAIQQIMNEEYQAGQGAGSSYKPTEEDAYRIAQQRGLWPPKGPDLTPAAGPPPAGRIRYHNVAVTEPSAPVSPEVRKLAVAIRASLDRAGLLLTGDKPGTDFVAGVNEATGEPSVELGSGARKSFIASLRQDYVPVFVVKGPNGETGASLRERVANLPRSHPLNPDSPNFHQRLTDGTIFDIEKREGWKLLKDPADWVPLLMQSYAKAIANDQVLSFAKGAIARRDGRPMLIKAANEQDIARIPAPTSGTERFRETVQARVGGATETHGYKFLQTPELDGYWVHPDFYYGIKFQLERAKLPMQWLLNLQQVDREIAMFNPLFHGYNQMSHHLMVSVIPGRPVALGLNLLKDPAVMRLVARYTHLVPARSAMNDMMDVVAGKFPMTRDAMDWTSPGDYLSLLGRAREGARMVLWEGMVRSAQAAAFVLARERYLGGGLAEEDANLAAGVYADRIVGAQDSATKLRWERVGSRYAFFAYNWTKTHVMQILESVPGLGPKVLQAEHPFLSDDAAKMLSWHLTVSTIRGALASYAYSQMLNFAITGLSSLADGKGFQPKFTWENEKGREWDLDITGAVQHSPFAKAAGGQRVYASSPFMRFPQWYEQYVNDILKAGGFNRGLITGSGEFLKNKLMAPWPAAIDAANHMIPGGSQWSTEEQLQHFLTGAGSTGGILPLAQQLTRSDVGQAAGELLGGQPGKATSRLGLGVASMLGGNNPPYYGPGTDLGQQLDPKQARQVDIYLASHGISPIKATPQQRDEAYRAISGSLTDPTTGMANKFIKEEKQALVDAGVSLQRQQQLTDNGRSPFEDLNVLAKTAIFQKHPDLELWNQVESSSPVVGDREIDRQTKAYHLAVADMATTNKSAQQTDDQLFRSGQISEFVWRDRRAKRLQQLYGKEGSVAALQDTYPQALITQDQWNQYLQKHGRPPRGIAPEDVAYNSYKAFNLDGQQYQLSDGTPDVVKWWKDRQGYFGTLPRAVQTYIEAREAHNRTPLEDLYEQAVREYVTFEAQNPEGARAYHTLYSTTNNPMAVKVSMAQSPGLAQYRVLRNVFFMEHPLVAFFFQHGTGLQKSLLAGGVSPLDTPASQLQQLAPSGQLSALMGGQAAPTSGAPTQFGEPSQALAGLP